jgi:DNA modification methylase
VSDYQLFHGDCLEVMAGMEENSIDSIVCDPPYGLSKEPDIVDVLTHWLAGDKYKHGGGGFMGKSWDSFVPGPEYWRACYRVLKPGGYILCFASSRTFDLMAIALRLAEFECHPFIAWVFGSGFPKATNLSKMLDKAAGAEREVLNSFSRSGRSGGILGKETEIIRDITAPATPEAQQWDGWFYGKQSMKPAMEPVLLFQKPPKGRMVDNVLEWGTGAINVDGCRVGRDAEDVSGWSQSGSKASGNRAMSGANYARDAKHDASGRWPANLVLSYPEDEYDANGKLLPNPGKDEVLAGFPVTGASKQAERGKGIDGATFKNVNGEMGGVRGHNDNGGSAARFFYVAKSSKRDRNEGLDGTCTVKYNVDKSNLILSGGLSWGNVYAGLVQSLQKATSGIQTVKWLIDESGESITGLCPLDSLSTTLTEISRITTSEILNLLTPSLTSAFIPAVNSEMANGGNPAESAENSSKYQQTTTNGSQESARGASLVVSKMLSVIRDGENWKHKTNIHSTVKPTDLMRYLCRLVTPPEGIVLDPFMGSGSTGKAALLEGFQFIGIEQDAEYIEIARRRIEWAFQQAHPTTGEFVTKAGRAEDTDGLPMFGGEQ